jgi:hypothetical protein
MIIDRKLCTLFALASLAGCHQAEKAPVHDTFTKVLTSGKANLPIDTIQYGATTQPIKTTSDYAWLQFSGNIGDNVDIWVRSQDGDAIAFLLDGDDNVLAVNDDANATTTDAHIVSTLGADGTYYIAFREYSYAPATFVVTLQGSGVFTCARDTECVAVPQAGCCHNGWNQAVNQSRVEEYGALYACTDVAPVCPTYIVQDKRVAECSNVTHKCEMIDPSQIRCGGFINNAHQCPAGWRCQLTPPGDIAGHCIPTP